MRVIVVLAVYAIKSFTINSLSGFFMLLIWIIPKYEFLSYHIFEGTYVELCNIAFDFI